MEIIQAREIVNALTYKPGHRITLSTFDGKTSFNLRVAIPNSDPGNRWGSGDFIATFAGLPFKLEDVKTRRQLMDQLEDFLAKWDTHERLEWLKSNGTCVFAPHTPDGRGFYSATDANYSLED